MARSRSDVKFIVNAAFFREIKEDHHQLHRLLERVRHLVNTPRALPNHWKEFTLLLADLRDQLAFHFALEEAYGYFEDAVERAPRFHETAGKLRNQHADIYLLAQQIADNAAVLPHAEAEQLAAQFVAFDSALASHESAELRLILDAMQLDVGVGD